MSGAPWQAAPAEGRVLPFRRPGSKLRFRRRSPWLVLSTGLFQAAVLVGIPVSLASWLLLSPTFALAHVEVSGSVHLPAAELSALTAEWRGENLWLLDLERVAGQLRSSAWVDSVKLEKNLPARLKIELVERRPIGVLVTSRGEFWIDVEGRRLGPAIPAEGEASRVRVALLSRPEPDLSGIGALLRELDSAAPDWAAGPLELGLGGDGDLRLRVAGLEPEIWMRAGTLRQRVAELRQWLPELARRYGNVERLDVRFERRIIVQPGRPEATLLTGAPDG